MNNEKCDSVTEYFVKGFRTYNIKDVWKFYLQRPLHYKV